MPRLNPDQFRITEQHVPGMSTDILAYHADDREGVAPVAAASLSWPEQDVATERSWPREGLNIPAQDKSDNAWKGRQGFFKGFGFESTRPTVTHAARTVDAPPGIVHEMLAAGAQRHGVVPYADQHLSHGGSAMSRSAAKRGLVIPHPMNPTMKQNITVHGEEIDRNEAAWNMVASVETQADIGRSVNVMFGREDEPHAYTDDERHNARLRVARSRVPSQPVYIQRTLPGIRAPRVARKEG